VKGSSSKSKGKHQQPPQKVGPGADTGETTPTPMGAADFGELLAEVR